MFLKPFLKYLRPFKTRLVFGLLCMVGVSFFSTYNILLAKPVLEILFDQVRYEDGVAEFDKTILDHKKTLADLSTVDDLRHRMEYRWKKFAYPLEEKMKRRVIGSAFFVPEEFKRPEKLAERMKEWPSSLADLLRGKLSSQTKTLLNSYEIGSVPSQQLIALLTKDLNKVLAGPVLYKKELFEGVKLDGAVLNNILKPHVTESQIKNRLVSQNDIPKLVPMLSLESEVGKRVRLNRLLLQAAFTKAMSADQPTSFYLYASKSKTKCLRLIAGTLVLIAFLAGLLGYGFKYHLSYSLYSMAISLKSDLFRHVLEQDMRFFNQNSVGFLMSRITTDVQALRNVFELVIKNVAQQVIMLVFTFSILLVLNAEITGYVFLLVLPTFGLLAVFARLLRKVGRKQKRKRDDLSAVMNESLESVRLIKSLATEEIECDRFDNHNFKLFRYEMQQRVAKFASAPIMEFLGVCGVALILVVAGRAIANDDPIMPPADFMTYIVVLVGFYRPIKKISNFNVNWQMGRVSSERVLEILDLQPTVTDPPVGTEVEKIEKVKQGIEVSGVTFAYSDQVVLNNISVDFPCGKTTAIVGRSGSGKTTLANLLLRLYDPNEGSIKIDGHDLRQFKVKDLRSHFGIVTQDTILFDDTVANNIAYGCDDVHRDRIIDAAKAANAHDFIMGMDGGKGYDTQVGPSGSSLSGGQRQRLAIARAFYRDPEILLLDEATSSLDNESESTVQDNLKPLMQDRTVIIIAHRLSTIMHADKILVLCDGVLAEQGTHQELIDNKSHYAKLYEMGEFSAQ